MLLRGDLVTDRFPRFASARATGERLLLGLEKIDGYVGWLVGVWMEGRQNRDR